jgi:hypothetical protein
MGRSSTYRRLTRTQAAAILAALAGLGALAIWAATQWADVYAVRISDLASASPEQAAEVLGRHLRVLAALNALVGWVIAAYVAWYGYRGLRTAALPPPGAWILEGQRVHEGSAAVRRAKLLMLLGGAIALLSAGMSLTLWRLALRMAEFVV